MPALGVSQKPVVMPTYPHMLAEDTAVWTKYLQSPLVMIKELWYDVHVGAAIPLPAEASDQDRRIAAGISRKRIDVVARVGGGMWVIEVKPRANMVALGQALTYTRLFIEEYRPQGEVWAVIVCDSADEDLVNQFDELGVAVIVN
ncbi:unnamed protein product [marine sediment metagenome]|uniref:DUF91 domain-containing protein n=1 Tax=marine sediment metagenome TaxID=412755 RepID=X1FTR2_9ZZZZ